MTQPQRLAIVLGLLIGLSACATSNSEGTAAKDTVDTVPSATETQEQVVEPDSDLIPDDPDAATSIPDAELPEALDDDLCGNMVIQQEMNRCAQGGYQQASAQLSRVYQDLQQDLPASGQQALSSAELAWVAFRDRDCTFKKAQFSGGSIVPLIYNSCLESHTEARIAELKQPKLPQLSYQDADAQLNETYQALLAVLSESESSDITDVQLAWIEYRDRNCAFEILYGSDVIEESQCLSRMSETRTAQLVNDIEQRSL